MKSVLGGRWSGFLCACFGCAMALSILLSYQLFVQVTNEYLGYVPIYYGIFEFSLIGFAVFLLALSLKSGVRKPSDFFFLLYALFVIAPYCVLFEVRGRVDESVVLLAVAFLVAPMLVLWATRKVYVRIPALGIFSSRQMEFMVYGIVAIALLLLVRSGIASAGFDMETSYDRRLEGRDIFQAGAAVSYLVSMVSNSFLPLMSFWSGYAKRIVVFCACIFGCVLLFYYLGLKAPFFYVTMAAGFGWYGRALGFSGVSRIFFGVVLLVFGISFVELAIYDYSYIADYVIRRAFAVPPFLISAYTEMFSQSFGYWDLVGGALSGQPISMLMGEYLGDPTLNANTNSFLYAFGSLGLYGYLLDVFLVSFVFFVVDRLYVDRKDPALMWVGFLFSILLVEQSSTTVLVSSGVAASLLLIILKRDRC